MNNVHMSPKRDTQRALHLLCSYQAKLSDSGEQILRDSLQEVTCVLRSNLFQALLDIQECYELMLNSSNRDVTESIKLDPPKVEPQTTWELDIGDNMTCNQETQCVRVTWKITEQKEIVQTVLCPLHTTLPKILLVGFFEPNPGVATKGMENVKESLILLPTAQYSRLWLKINTAKSATKSSFSAMWGLSLKDI